MASRSTPRTSPAEGPATNVNLGLWDWPLDLGRQQFAAATEGTSALLRGLAAMRRIQEQTVRQASEQRTAMAEKLRQCSAVEVLAVQAQLLRQDMEVATIYWQQLAAAAMEMNSELCACAGQLALVDAEDLLSAAAPRFLHS